jgi:flagellar biosynthesis anti-sigma factor FlgM
MKGITGNPVLDAYGRMAISPVGAARPVEAAVDAGGGSSAASTPAADVKISSNARDLAASGRLDTEKVEALKSQIAEGKFRINSQDVARRMLEALG